MDDDDGVRLRHESANYPLLIKALNGMHGKEMILGTDCRTDESDTKQEFN